MCGLVGEIRFDDRSPDLGRIQAMAQAMEPRGPDAFGSFAQNALAVAHRRLMVMDTTEHSQQPMVDPELGLGIVFNGAIYNHPELRRTLEDEGYRFQSHGDTEVVLKAYHRWGPEFLQRLNGMFAFAIWERDSGRLFLARDRLGIKPLYLAEDRNAIRFASSLPALLAGGGVDTRIDPVALHHYMSFHAVVPAPYTLLRGVRKLEPGTWLQVEPDGRTRRERWWEVRFERDAADAGMHEKDWQDAVLAALRRAVERRLVADVPVGVLLSGGLDSSLIVGLLAEAGQRGLNTYSIGFETIGDEQGDEFHYSDIVAKHFDTRHHQIRVDSSAERLIPALRAALHAMSEPMVSHDAVGFFMLSERVSRDIRVVQSGQGADEVFAGYHWYPPMLESNAPLDDYAKVFFDRDHDEFARAVHPDLVGDDHSRAFVGGHFERPGADTPADRALRLDTTIMLVDDPVKRVDNMTMAFGLEARVPFLDHELVELAARIPPELKVREGGKHVLKEAARAVIPNEVIDRPKGYFPVPALKYIRGSVLDFVHEVLDSDAARQRTLFNRDYVDTLLAEPEGHITPLRGSKLWQVAALEAWLQSHGVNG